MADVIYTDAGVYIAKAMLEFLNKWPDKPSDILLEDFAKKPPSMMLQQLSGAYKKRMYVDGSYIGKWPFAVYFRISGRDTASKINATGRLMGLFEWLLKTPLPDLGVNRKALKVEMTSLPSIAARYEDGMEDYQAVFELEFKQGGFY